MTNQEKVIIEGFFVEQFEEMQKNGGNFANFLVEFCLQTKAKQVTQIQAWLAGKKIEVTSLSSSLDARKLAEASMLTAKISLIDSVTAQL